MSKAVEAILAVRDTVDIQYKVMQEVPDEKEQFTLTRKVGEDEFILVEAEMLSMNDEFMEYKPRNSRERVVKKLIAKAITSGVKNFYRPKYDPSFTEDGNGISFAPGKMPALGKTYAWWEKAAKEYSPKFNSQIGTRMQYAAFLGVLIKKMRENGNTLEQAWGAICNDSYMLGHYQDSKNAKKDFEVTGSREVCGFCDLANTYKMLAEDGKLGGFWVACGDCNCAGGSNPLSFFFHYDYPDCTFNYGAVGWVVCS